MFLFIIAFRDISAPNQCAIKSQIGSLNQSASHKKDKASSRLTKTQKKSWLLRLFPDFVT